MEINSMLLEVLVCPETKSSLTLAEEETISDLNKKIEAGLLQNRRGDKITEKIEGGLVTSDGKYLYPIRQNIPLMLIDERFSL